MPQGCAHACISSPEGSPGLLPVLTNTDWRTPWLGFPLQNKSLWAISQGCIFFASSPTAEAPGFSLQEMTALSPRPPQLKSVGQTLWGERHMPPRAGCWRIGAAAQPMLQSLGPPPAMGLCNILELRATPLVFLPPPHTVGTQASWLPEPRLLFNPCSEGSSLSPGRETIPPHMFAFAGGSDTPFASYACSHQASGGTLKSW